jgi:SAM-dependent methyltransferase
MWLLWALGLIILVFGFVVFRGAPYVPSHRRRVERAFDDLYPLGRKDVVVDVGSGDGIVLRLASKRGAEAIGYELNPILVLLSQWLSRGDQRVHVHLADFWLTALPDTTTLVYGFMVTRDIEKMADKMQHEANRLNRPLYFICYGAAITSHPRVKQLGAHHLYRFDPLQANKA